jgi:hypothetical protein
VYGGFALEQAFWHVDTRLQMQNLETFLYSRSEKSNDFDNSSIVPEGVVTQKNCEKGKVFILSNDIAL